MRNQALEEFGLTGTPTFFVNGKNLTGDKTLEQLAAEIDPLI
jgi:protein-disulfide isomerase